MAFSEKPVEKSYVQEKNNLEQILKKQAKRREFKARQMALDF
jgi:hypothetical protein